MEMFSIRQNKTEKQFKLNRQLIKQIEERLVKSEEQIMESTKN